MSTVLTTFLSGNCSISGFARGDIEAPPILPRLFASGAAVQIGRCHGCMIARWVKWKSTPHLVQDKICILQLPVCRAFRDHKCTGHGRACASRARHLWRAHRHSAGLAARGHDGWHTASHRFPLGERKVVGSERLPVRGNCECHTGRGSVGRIARELDLILPGPEQRDWALW